MPYKKITPEEISVCLNCQLSDCNENSPQCYYHRNQKKESPQKDTLPPIPCVFCGKEFIPQSRKTLYCSRECRVYRFQKSVRERNTRELADMRIICIFCGKVFSPAKKFQKYCSVKCRRQYRLEHEKEERQRCGNGIAGITQTV